MAVLITGGAGYIGSHVCVELLAGRSASSLLGGKHDVVVLDNFSNSSPVAMERTKRLCGKDFPFYNIDARDGEKLDEIFTKHCIDCVIHFAGFKAAGGSVEKPLDYYGNNLQSTIALCEAMQRHNVKKFIFSSSATVYSGNNTMPLTETSETGSCINPYGWTKYICEQILRDTAAANKDWSVAILRYFNVVGAHESGDIGDDPTGIPANLLPYITQTAVGRLEYLPVYGTDYDTPDGTCIRDYIHVTDLAKGHIAAINFCDKNTGTEVFNLGTGRGTSNLEFVKAFESASGVTVPMKFMPRRAGDLPVSYTATDKAEKVLGWRAEKTVKDSCRDSFHWQSKNPYGYA